MDFQFVIPHTNSELLNSNANNYFVKQVFHANDLMRLLTEAKNAFNMSDPFYIFDHFDTYFSLIENSNSVQMATMIRSCDLLYVTIDKYGQKLSVSLQDNQLGERISHLNLTKMVLFLMIGMVKCIDQKIQANDANADESISRRQANRKNTEYDYDWESKRFNVLLQIYNFIQLPLEKLWPQSIPEEDFVNMVCDLGYRTLEHPAIKEKRVSDTIFQIFGTAIKRYNHAMVFPVRVLQILRTCEMATASIANGIHLLYEEYEIKTIFSILLTDLIETLSADSADTQTAKNFSQFIIELGSVAPKEIMPHLSTMGEELLNLESYTIRNSILEIMGNVLITQLASEELSMELKEIRDIFLEDLFNHMMDISAHVRSKVLQIWNHMKNENSVPLIWHNKVLEMASERLEDKATLVRKHAVHLIKAFLETNPFAAKLTLSELKANLEKEIDKLQNLRNKMIEQEKSLANLEEQWDSIFPDLITVIQEMLPQGIENLDGEIIEDSSDDFVQEINELLLAKNYHRTVLLVRHADRKTGNQDAVSALSFDQQCIYLSQLIKSYLFVNQQDFSEEFATQDQTVKFLKDSIAFSSIVAQTVPKIENMLMSKVNSDVFEAIDFFTTAFLFGIKDTECGMRKMLYLVWCGDKEKRESVVKAYQRILFGTDLTGRAHAIKVVDNLCNFFENITVGQFAAMEVLMRDWVQGNVIDTQIIQVMFERFTMKLPETSANKSRLALQLLKMAAAGKQSIATANIDIIQSICFEERGLQDPRLFASGIEFLSHLVSPQESSKYYKRYDSNHELIKSIVDIFEKLFFVKNLKNFDEIASKTLNFFYRLCQAPDLLCQKLIFDLCQKLNEISKSMAGDDGADDGASADDNNSTTSLPDYLWSRIIFVFGYCAMKELIFLDIDVYNNMKYRQDLMEEKKNSKKANKRKTLTASASVNISASNALKRLSGSAAEPQQEPDEMLVGATAEDSIAELINLICESELLFSSNGVFPKIIPIVMEILKYPGKYQSDLMQQSACLTLIHFMSVSSKFCENNMQFLMGILRATKNTALKCNIVTGLSDLTFRFPNIIEPWTHHFYSTLHDEDDEVRLTAVKMISHLILHEMIRVKGQISDLALCIVDRNDEIKNITQQFFKEIAHKSNILYNVLPDIISRLGSASLQLEEEKYRIIMKYIMSMIHKDRQVESLVEKLCLRFRVANDERQWRDIAYCLSLLNYTEKTIKKLIDNVHCFRDKVQEDEVYECFKTIISNASKLAKPEMKTIVGDFEAKLKECLNVTTTNDDNGNADDSVQNERRRSNIEMPPPKKIPNRARGKKGQDAKNKRPNVNNKLNKRDSDDDDVDDDDGDEDFAEMELRNSRVQAARSKRGKKVAQRGDVAIAENSDEDDEQPSNRRQRNKRRN